MAAAYKKVKERRKKKKKGVYQRILAKSVETSQSAAPHIWASSRQNIADEERR